MPRNKNRHKFDFEMLRHIILYYHTDVQFSDINLLTHIHKANPKKFLAHIRFLEIIKFYAKDKTLSWRGRWLVKLMINPSKDEVKTIYCLAVKSGSFLNV